MKNTTSNTNLNSIFGTDGQPQQGEPVFVSYGADQYIDASDVSNTIVLAFGAGDDIHIDNSSGYPDDGLGTNNTIFALGNDTSVEAGSGSNNIYLFGQNDTMTGYGMNDVWVEGKNAQLNTGVSFADGGNSTITLDSTGAIVTIVPGLVADAEYPTGSNTVIANGAGTATVTGAGDVFSFVGGKGHYDVEADSTVHSTISGGSGGGTFTGGWFETYRYTNNGVDLDSTNTITAGTQSSTVVGGAYGSSTLIAAGKAGDVLIAGEYGNDTLSGGKSTGNNLYEGFTGTYRDGDTPTNPTVVIHAGSGNDTLVAGYAPETLTGGAGSDTFLFRALPTEGQSYNRTSLITDFTHGIDKLDVAISAESVKQIIALETVSGGSTQLAFNDGSSVTLAHVTGLTASDFTHS